MALPGPLRDWAEAGVRAQIEDFRDVGYDKISELEEEARNVTEEALSEMVDKAGDLGAELFERLMPEAIPKAIQEVSAWINNGYETLRFVQELVSQPEPLLNMLEQPREIVHLACVSEACGGKPPTTPELSHLGTSTARLFEDGMDSLASLTDDLSTAELSRHSSSSSICPYTVTEALSNGHDQLTAFVQDQEAVQQLRPFTKWYSTCGTEAAQRSKRLGLPLQILANIWRSLTEPGGFLHRLKRSFCYEKRLRTRACEQGDNDCQEYHVPSWLAPHFCDSAGWAVELGSSASDWLDETADNIWEKLLEACAWASDQLKSVQEVRMPYSAG